MIRLKDRGGAMGGASIPGGYYWFEPQTGWDSRTVCPQTQNNFYELCLELRKHRQANPRFNLTTDLAEIQDQVDAANALRLMSLPGASSYITQAAPQTAPVLPKSLPQLAGAGSVAGVRKFVSNTAAGIGLYMEWFGQGPVPHDVAERRAARCAECPKMVNMTWLTRWTEAMAQKLSTVVSLMNDLSMSTSYDDKLKICDPCDCPMRVKVHTPLPLIQKHLRLAARKGLWERCWITEEERPVPPPEMPKTQ